MPNFNLKSAANRLSKLVQRAESGEEIVLLRGTKPVAQIVPITPRPRVKRKFGHLKGLAKIGPEFFDPLPEDELKAWEGS